MRPSSLQVRALALVTITVGAFPACGDAASGEAVDRRHATARQAPAAAATCPPVADVGKAMGTPVTLAQSIGRPPGMTCMYELTGRYRGVFVELMVQPASRAEPVFERMRKDVKAMKGQEATPDRIDIGEGGWAFGSGSVSRAAVVAKGHLYRASMQYMAFGSMGDQKEALIRVLEVAIR